MGKREDLTIPVELAWAVACAAYRINDGYFKAGFAADDQKANTELIYEILQDQSLLTPQDHKQGVAVRDYIGKTATMATLRGTLDTWGQEMARVSQLETVTDRFSFHIIASMPQTYAHYLQREKAHTRLSETADHTQLAVKDKIEITAEVIEIKFSVKWQCHYITVIDTENRSWFFAHRRSLPRGSRHVFRGTVKRVDDRMVQLNRVKILEQ
ncbi:hypothetical protein UFOVP328_28 [uncultured Caudovirales phage]|uniref:Uncharacterized protein n=1 Tax=uncultured Caudovirales phage TaxID=2100421 RepID=A0A6J5LWE3_9CAUD|nr:hypothetical protein UFOVP328_28 [uncultured Caudovirales phage]